MLSLEELVNVAKQFKAESKPLEISSGALGYTCTSRQLGQKIDPEIRAENISTAFWKAGLANTTTTNQIDWNYGYVNGVSLKL